MQRRVLPLLSLSALLTLQLTGCDKLSSLGSGSKKDPETAGAADSSNASARADLDRKIEDKKAEIDRATADIANQTDEQAKIDAVNKLESLRQELNDLVEQRGRM